MEPGGPQPFYSGDVVIAVDALPGAWFKNGFIYKVSACEHKKGCGDYWYIGIEGHTNGEAHYRPSIFALVQEKLMTFEETTEQVKILSN